MSKKLNYDLKDERNYIVLVPIGKEKNFVDSIVDLFSSNEEPIKIVFSKQNCSFRFIFLRLPKNSIEIQKKLDEFQNKILCNL